eukprot:g78127.t1
MNRRLRIRLSTWNFNVNCIYSSQRSFTDIDIRRGDAGGLSALSRLKPQGHAARLASGHPLRTPRRANFRGQICRTFSSGWAKLVISLTM